MDWNGLRVFLAVARRGSLRGASQALDVSHSTISRRLAALESELGCRLFDGTPDGYRPTAAGLRILALAEQVEDGIYGIERLVTGGDDRIAGRIRLTTPLPMFTHFLAPHLARFAEAHPEIELDIDTDASVLDLDRREADLAIRILRQHSQPPDNLVGRRLGFLHGATYATEAYLAAHDPRDPESGATWLGWEERTPHPAWVRESDLPEMPARHSVSDVSAQVAAVRGGMGIGRLPMMLAECEPDLVRVPGTQAVAGYEVWMLSHPDLRDTARLGLLKQFLLEIYEAHDLVHASALPMPSPVHDDPGMRLVGS